VLRNVATFFVMKDITVKPFAKKDGKDYVPSSIRIFSPHPQSES